MAKDCSEDMLKDYLKDKGVNVVEVEQLTKQEVLDQVRTLTFRVSVKAADYEAALKPELWPYRVGVRHYRPPRREARPEGSWQGQSGRTGGHVDAGQAGQARHKTNSRQLPTGHPDRVIRNQQQTLGQMKPGPVDVSNFFSILAALGSGMELNNHQ